MPLATQNVFVPLGTGVRRDIDEHVLPVGSTSVVFNGVYNHLGELVKRPGSTLLTMGITPGASSVANTWQLATHKNSLVNLERAPTIQPIEVYSPAKGQWASPPAPGVGGTAALSTGRRGPVATGLIPVASDTATNIPGDVAVSGNFIFITHTTSANVVRFYVMDATTNKIVYRWKVASSATHPKLVVVNGYVTIFYFDTVSRIKADVFLIGAFDSGTGAPLATYNVTPADAMGIFDGTVGSATQAAIAYRQNANQLWRIDFTPSTGATVATQILTAAAAAINPSLALCWLSDLFTSGKLAVATAGPAGLQTQWDLTGGTPARTDVLDAGATANISHITGHTTSSSAAGDYQVLYEDNTAGGDARINMGQRLAGVTTTGLWIRSVSLTSRTFVNASNVYLLINYSAGAIQETYYLMHVPSDALTNPNPTPQARIAIGNAVRASSLSNLPSVVSSGSLFLTEVGISKPAVANLATAVNLASVQFNPTLGVAVEAADAVFVPGGGSPYFDGSFFGAFDFDVFPEAPLLSSTAGVGLTANGIYFYQAVYARVDANGRTIRSAPSVPAQITMGPGPGNLAVSVIVTNHRLTNLAEKIEIYRTVANVTAPLQLVGTIDNNPNAITSTFTDTIPDVNAASGTPIYTTGGVLEHNPTPGFSCELVANERLFGVSMDDPSLIWVSNQFVDGEVPSFNAAFAVRIADEHGPITGLGVIDDKIVALKADVVYAFNGDGPDPSGRGGFSAPQIIVRGVGSTNPQGILAVPDGLAFMSTATTRGGIQLIDRSLSLRVGQDGSSFGGPVKDDTDQFAVVAACLVPTLSQARWYLSNKIVCVYDYIRGLWTEFFYADTNTSTLHAVCWNGSGTFAGNTQAVIVDSTSTSAGSYTDAGSVPYFYSLASPWIQLAGISGFERLYKIQGVGATDASHVLTVQVFADFDLKNPIGTYTGTPGAAWDWECIPKVQRGRAFRIVIFDASSTSAGPKITGITCKLGITPGLNRLAASKRLTAA